MIIYISAQVKTHTGPDWGLADCADSLELEIEIEEIFACANGEEVKPRNISTHGNENRNYI